MVLIVISRALASLTELPKPYGTAVAISWVGQRDTRWLIPLTVSSGYRGEEGNHDFEALQASHDCSAFYLPCTTLPRTTRLKIY